MTVYSFVQKLKDENISTIAIISIHYLYTGKASYGTGYSVPKFQPGLFCSPTKLEEV